MLQYQRIKRLYPWKLLVKKGEQTSQTVRVPQYSGIPGWLLLTHNEKSEAKALFVTTKSEEVPIVLDERLFSDTVLRVVRVKPSIFLAYDIPIYNGTNLVETKSYSKRSALLKTLLDTFHSPDLTALVLPEDAPYGSILRGHEWYDEDPGTMGVFIPAVE